ncbi:hypothetical protein B296_00022511 [Ensete ventricosum]|uniref:Uncharacterized protein n=1 Tax=Ensete ventricosum TaxID=4639 RepID=A0A426ZF51_ENSVE|nr:hypothetical protein B296_00022511 [Ensete ventricosum]
MLPLRFPNSGIRAMVFMRKISFKLHVMRLNSIESFYVFLLRFYSEGNEEGRPTTARPQPRLAGGRLRLGLAPLSTGTASCDQPAGVAAARGHSRMQRDARKGLPPTGVVVPVAGVVTPW